MSSLGTAQISQIIGLLPFARRGASLHRTRSLRRRRDASATPTGWGLLLDREARPSPDKRLAARLREARLRQHAEATILGFV
jgi:hypothetical protein